MNDLVIKYSANLTSHSGTLSSPGTETILLTGTTGSLGTALLVALASSTDVGRIYAMNRPGKVRSRERQKAALQAQAADLSILDSPRITWLETDTTAPDLGLSPDILQEASHSYLEVAKKSDCPFRCAQLSHTSFTMVRGSLIHRSNL